MFNYSYILQYFIIWQISKNHIIYCFTYVKLMFNYSYILACHWHWHDVPYSYSSGDGGSMANGD